MKIVTMVEFSGVPKGTTGTAERDYDESWIAKDKVMYKVEWDLPLRLFGNKLKPLTDWFDDSEFKKYLKVIKD